MGLRHPLVAIVCISALLAGCLGRAPEPAVLDAGARNDAGPPSILSWHVETALGEARPPDRAPRRPVIVISASVELDATLDAIVLFRGIADDALLDDLERAPLRAATDERRIAVELRALGPVVEARPLVPLEPGTPHVIAVAGWAADASGRTIAEPFTGSFRVASGPSAGAALASAWPADGTFAVPPRLPLVALRFDGDVDGIEHIALRAAGGAAIPARVEDVLCDGIGWADGRCVAVRPDVVLAPGTSHEVIVGEDVRDATGASIGPALIAWSTGPAIGDAPSFVTIACAPDEMDAGVGCALVDDRSIALRVAADGPLRMWLLTADAARSAVAPRGEATLRLDGLVPGAAYDGVLRVVDLAGRERTFSIPIVTEADLPLLSITEVRADPRGAEPSQEYVEIANQGGSPIDLAGFTLSDRADREGDPIARALVLPPGGRALIVADAFDPVDAEDDAVPAGVPLVRIGSSIGSGGITNAGEPLFLRDPLGRRVSAAPPLAAPAPGACIVRVSDDPRVGDAAAFSVDAELGCTPGRPDRLP